MNRKEILIISITIFLTVIAWSIAEIIHINSSKKTENVLGNINVKSFKIDKKIFPTLEIKNP
jgi:diketogulonate reductase-like aldo/keto reductase